MREFWYKIVHTSGARIYSLFLGIFSLAITTRWLGPEGRGELTAITTWVTTFSTFVYLSLGQVAIHRATKNQNHNWLAPSLSVLLTFTVIFSILGWVVALALYIFTGGAVFGTLPPAFLALEFLMLPLMIWENYGSSLLMAVDMITVANRYQVIGRSLDFILKLVFIPGVGLAVLGGLLARIMGQLVIASGGMGILLRKAGKLRAPNYSDTIDFLKGGLTLHLNAIGTFLFTTADILMLNYYRGVEETGYYQLGVQLMNIMMIVPQSASMVMYGKVTSLGADGAWREHKKILLQVTSLMIFGAILMYFSVPWWLILIAGKEFEPTVNIFRWQLLAVIGMTFSIVMGPQWIGRGYFKLASAITLSVGITNLIANFFLIPRYGMYGAIWATIGTYTFSVFGNGIMALWCENRSKIIRKNG